MSNGLTDQFSGGEDTDWQSMKDWHLARSCYEPAQPVDQSATRFYYPAQRITQSNVIPLAVAVCWSLLYQSRLREETRNLLVSTASSRVTRSAEGLGPLDATSLATFLHFWTAVRIEATDPEIVVSPKGNIQAEWTKDEDNFLVLEFQPDGEILFSLWQDGYPTEGVKSARRAQELVNMLGAMDENPLSWSDAA